MKHLKKVIAALFFGFLAFAPPGTLIVIGAIILGVLGRTWFIAGVVAALFLLAICAFVFRSRLAESRILRGVFRKLKW